MIVIQERITQIDLILDTDKLARLPAAGTQL
jgi:hypothetical protein